MYQIVIVVNGFVKEERISYIYQALRNLLENVNMINEK